MSEGKACKPRNLSLIVMHRNNTEGSSKKKRLFADNNFPQIAIRFFTAYNPAEASIPYAQHKKRQGVEKYLTPPFIIPL